jgi:mono/diheme cytochrome c family protein
MRNGSENVEAVVSPRFAALFFAGWVVLAAAGCGPGMEDQPSVESYEEAMPPMPAGAIARSGGDPVPGDDAAALRNPFPATRENLARGAALFNIYCTPCHGTGARGDGLVAGPLGVDVRDLTGDYVAALTDGEVFRTIGHGNGAMLGLRGLIAPEERWLIVLEVRARARQAAGAPQAPDSVQEFRSSSADSTR